ncbi:MAG: hypothetical protein KAJ93_04930 [Methanosarcinales archaeon]|nr:hypothetical protein [Methanosarcinales archaeon]
MTNFLYSQLKNTEFTDEELIEIETIRVEHGLNWHDFILDAARLYNRDPQSGMDVD